MKNLKDEIEGILEAIIGDMDYVSEYCDGTDSREQAEENRGKLLAFITSLIEQEKERAVEELHNFVRSNTLGGRFMDDGGGYFNADAVLREDIEQYLAERKGE